MKPARGQWKISRALAWWHSKDPLEKANLTARYKPELSWTQVNKSTAEISRIWYIEGEP